MKGKIVFHSTPQGPFIQLTESTKCLCVVLAPHLWQRLCYTAIVLCRRVDISILVVLLEKKKALHMALARNNWRFGAASSHQIAHITCQLKNEPSKKTHQMLNSIVFCRQKRLWPLSDFSHNPRLRCVLISQLDLLFCNDACCGVYSSESLRDFSFLIISLSSWLLRTQFPFFQKHLITFSQLQPKKKITEEILAFGSVM